MRNKHLQIVGCLGILSKQCEIQQIFAITCLKSGIQRFNDYTTTPTTGFSSYAICVVFFGGNRDCIFSSSSLFGINKKTMNMILVLLFRYFI